MVVGKHAGYEADDFLAAAVAAEEKQGGTALVASGDRDAFQLASETTTILQPARAGELVRIGPRQVRERYGVEPSQVPDFIALRGDPSDKIPGARGVGAQTAASLLKRHPDLEAMIAAGRFSDPGRRTPGCTAGSPPWTPQRRCRRCRTARPPGSRRQARPQVGAEGAGGAALDELAKSPE